MTVKNKTEQSRAFEVIDYSVRTCLAFRIGQTKSGNLEKIDKGYRLHLGFMKTINLIEFMVENCSTW